MGRDLVRALLERGDEVAVLDRGGDPGARGVDVIHGDIRDPGVVRDACRGRDVVFHVASLVHTKHNQVETVRAVNVDGTRHVIDACRSEGIPRLVYVSSASVVYEGEDIEYGDERLPYARTLQAPYAQAKAEAERAVLEADDPAGLRTCAIRPHVVFGPGDNRFLPAILDRVDAGQLRFTIGRGEPRLSDFTYVANLSDALLRADEALEGDAPAGGQAYFITNGEPMPFWDFVGAIAEARGRPRPRYVIPFAVAYAVAAVREGLDTLRGGDPRRRGTGSPGSRSVTCAPTTTSASTRPVESWATSPG